jgi:hypothetical protein
MYKFLMFVPMSFQISHLSCIGGSNEKDVIRGVLAAVMTSALARRFNWYGKKGKLSFQQLELQKVVTGIYQRSPCIQIELAM